jgi:fibronectin type 3 domain-containing protein
VVIVAAKDVFPPKTPQAVVATFVPRSAGQPPYVDLVWDISTDTDFAGYKAYRSESAGSPGESLTTELLVTPTFSDTTISPGRQYYYRISAVDRSGNESPLSDPTSIDTSEPQP